MRLESGISRKLPAIDGKSSGCWRVIVVRSGKTFTARFMDSYYESPDHAHRAAQVFLVELLKLLPPERRFCRLGSDGLPGSVTRMSAKNSFWRALLTVDKKKLCKTFAISKYGDEEARQLALSVRESWLKQYGFTAEPPLPSDAEVDQLLRSIRTRFNESRKTRSKTDGFNDVERYGLIRQEADVSGVGGCWIVGITRRGVVYRKQFSDPIFGSSDHALKAATDYRDEIIAKTKPMSRRERQECLSSRNTTGVAGVLMMKDKKGIQSGWGAQIFRHGKAITRYFSFKKHSPEQAFELAVQARKEMLLAVEGDCTLSPAAKKLMKRQPPRVAHSPKIMLPRATASIRALHDTGAHGGTGSTTTEPPPSHTGIPIFSDRITHEIAHVQSI